MADDDQVLLMCGRVGPGDAPPPGKPDLCHKCFCNIWISDSSERAIARQFPDKTITVLCTQCALGIMEAAVAPAQLAKPTEEQHDEMMSILRRALEELDKAVDTENGEPHE